ncbi:non-ribosomal peptide synthetase [Fibrivirga algicola]|uniref:Amino acid adenylation domain-containing protein n=1 Tax=Fibrivirga algicola TaxID=2950420 RepID=A0ABX0QKK6_9BACT|nr:non-ribosomal peptide synthetase [Fibrivirga algicola]NID11383.1 amino acid adenylation domain-containing protein [Fibrivirga algicola]
MRETTTSIISTAPDFDPFAGPQLARIVPTTQPQLEIWTACQLGGDAASCAYNESISLRLTGPLNQQAFSQAWAELVTRHDALRTTFSADGQQMCISDEVTIGLEINDLTHKSPTEQQDDLAEYIHQQACFPFDFQAGPLVQVRLTKLAAADWQFTLTAHHIICDGWSTGVLLQELGTLYSAYSHGIKPLLATAPQLADYAMEQQELADNTDYREIERYWLNQFRDNVPTLNLPTDTTRSVPRTFASRRAELVISAELVNAVRQLGLRTSSSLVGTLTAAFELWLHQLTHQNDIVLGLPTAGQLIVGQAGLVGHCVNLLPLRSRYLPQESFLQYLRKRRSAQLDAYEHQPLTFGSLLRQLAIPRDPARVTLVPVVFNVDLEPDKGVHFSGLTHQLLTHARAFENFELSLNALGTEGGLTLLWSYNQQLFRPETIARFHQSFADLLLAVTQQPDAALADLSIALTGKATGNVPAPFNEYPYPREKPLSTLLSETAREFPNKVAIRFKEEALTYAELEQQANQVAHALLAQGVKPGDRVGLAVDRSLPMVTGMLGILKTGAAYVPVDPQHPADRLTYVLTDAGCSVLLTSKAHQGRLALANVRELLVETLWPTLEHYPVTPPEAGPVGQDIAYILYTSGTTGRPKGALIRHHSVANVLFSIAREPGLTNTDKTIALATIAFDLAVVELYTPLLVGAELLLIDPATARNGEALAQCLNDPSITFIQTTPATLRLLLEAGWRGHAGLRLISCAEALPLELAQTLWGCCRELWNYYGPTETTIYATGKQILPTDERITIGHAIANTRIYLIDETGQQAAEGQPGEICIAGEGVSGVYLNQPELTAEKFIDNPFSAKPEKLYRTGDLGRYLNGGTPSTADIVYLGRIDQQVKIRGFRIELGEIEHTLVQLDGIKQVLVTAREDQPGDQRLVAYVVPEESPVGGFGESGVSAVGSEQAKTWRQQAAKLLPEYMLPTDFVLLPRFAVTTNGKIDRKALPAPPNTRVAAATAAPIPLSQQPETPEEQMLSALWSQVLSRDRIGLDDNFFELGGHSLMAVQLMARLQEKTGRRLPLASLFEYPTIRTLAALVREDDKPVSWESLVPIKPTGTRQPLYIVHGAGLNVLLFNAVAQNLHPDQPVYGLQAKGLNGVDEPLRSIESMAAHYNEEIIKHNPSGPYSLSGFSFGGIVAFEMARQLTEQGRKVALVALFDAGAYDPGHENPWWQRKQQRLTLLSNKVSHTMSFLAKHGWQGVNYKMESIDRRLIKKYWWLKSSTRPDKVLLRMAIRAYWQLKFGQAQQQEAILDTRFKIEAINDVALAEFRLRPADVAVHLFRATVQTFYMDDYEYYGWRAFALKGVHVHDVPGEHSYIFAPPNDKEFAQKLQAVLDGR